MNKFERFVLWLLLLFISCFAFTQARFNAMQVKINDKQAEVNSELVQFDKTVTEVWGATK